MVGRLFFKARLREEVVANIKDKQRAVDIPPEHEFFIPKDPIVVFDQPSHTCSHQRTPDCPFYFTMLENLDLPI